MSFLNNIFGGPQQAPPQELEVSIAPTKPEYPEFPKMPSAPLTLRAVGNDLNPGKLEDSSMIISNIIQPSPLEGANFDVIHHVPINNQSTAQLQITHAVAGVGTEKPAYSLTAQYESNMVSCVSRWSSEGLALARFFLPIRSGLLTTSIQSGRGQIPSVFNISAEQSGKSWTGGFKFEFPANLEFSFFQGLTKVFAAGINASVSPNKPMNAVGVLFKYQPRDNRSVYTLRLTPGNYAASAFFNPIPGIQFATEAGYGLTPQGPQAVLNSGVALQYLWSNWRGTLDDKLQLNTMYEENLTPMIKISVSMTNDLSKGDVKFGLGMSFSEMFEERKMTRLPEKRFGSFGGY